MCCELPPALNDDVECPTSLSPRKHLIVTLLLSFNACPGWFSFLLIYEASCGFSARSFWRLSRSSRSSNLL